MKSSSLRNKNLSEYSKQELIDILTFIEEKYNHKSEKLRAAHFKLARVRVRMKTQKKILNRLRSRVVELTPQQLHLRRQHHDVNQQ